MIVYVRTDQSGIVVEAGRAIVLPAGAMAVPNHNGNLRALGRSMVTGGVVVPRPQSPGVQSTGTQHSVTSMSTGTTVTVFDAIADEIMTKHTATTSDETFTFSLPDPGRYEIHIAAPAPALPTFAEVVTA